MPSERSPRILEVARNRRAKRDYELMETLEAGLALSGTEVKSLRAGKVSLAEAYVRASADGLWLERAHFAEYAQGNQHNHEPIRPRRLLVHKGELARLRQTVRQKGLTIVPLRLYFKGRWAKAEIALGRGRKHHDKREKMRARDDAQQIRKHLGKR